MVEKSCRCGAIKKNFRFDIGPFFIGECCESMGFDAQGNQIGAGKEARPVPSLETIKVEIKLDTAQSVPETSEEPQPETTVYERAMTFLGLNKSNHRAGGRGVLMETNITALKTMAKDLGITGVDHMNKKAIVAAILEKRHAQ